MSFKLTPPEGFKPSLPKFNNGHWLFPEQMGKAVGFIYVIRDNVEKKFYLGRKLFKTKRGADTNWRKYTSSSDLLNLLLKERGHDDFDFFCIEQYNTRGSLNYAETWSLCYVHALASDKWYNGQIEKVSWRVKELPTERHLKRLHAIIEMETFDEQ